MKDHATLLREAEEERRRQDDKRRRQEREAEEERRRGIELESLARGGETARQRRAAEYLRYLYLLSRGRWLPHAEEAATFATALDQGNALHVADRAAREAVASAMRPLIEEVERERQEAEEEREQILDKAARSGRRWFR